MNNAKSYQPNKNNVASLVKNASAIELKNVLASE